MICNKLFENVILQVTILEPQLYEPNIIINMKINQGANEFFMLLQPNPRVETIITKKESMPSHYGRTFLTDLLFDYFKKKNGFFANKLVNMRKFPCHCNRLRLAVNYISNCF